MYQWLEQNDEAQDLTRPDIVDPRLLAVADVRGAAVPMGEDLEDPSPAAALSARFGVDAPQQRTAGGVAPL